MNKILLKMIMCTDMCILPMNISALANSEIKISQKEDIQWIYKSKDRMIYRRKFNYTSDSWIGEWELCLSSFTDKEIEDAEQYTDDIVATMREHGATENTVFLKLDRGGILWNTVTDIRKQYPNKKTVMYLNDVWKFEKE